MQQAEPDVASKQTTRLTHSIEVHRANATDHLLSVRAGIPINDALREAANFIDMVASMCEIIAETNQSEWNERWTELTNLAWSAQMHAKTASAVVEASYREKD